MADINRDLDRYLRKRRETGTSYEGPGWFDKMFTAKEKEDHERLTPQEQAQLKKVETDIKRKEKEIEMVHEVEEELEEEQEEKVGFYQKLLRFFGQREQKEDEVIELEHTAPVEDTAAKEDFKTLARIQTTWLSRLPTRIRDEFKESEDYTLLTQIYERRGVAKRK